MTLKRLEGVQQTFDLGEASFESFYFEAYPAVARVAYGFTGSRQEADDLAQEAFVRCYEKWATVRLADSPLAWTIVVVSNLARSNMRRRRVAAKAALNMPRRSDAAQDNAWKNAEQHLDIERALRKIPRRQQQVLVLHYVGGLSISELAGFFDCTCSSIKTSLHRGRQRLARHLEEQ